MILRLQRKKSDLLVLLSVLWLLAHDNGSVLEEFLDFEIVDSIVHTVVVAVATAAWLLGTVIVEGGLSWV